MRDAMSEATFFQTYGNVFSLYLADKRTGAAEPVADARELPFVQAALAAIEEGGYPAALARVAYLLAKKGGPTLLTTLDLKAELLRDYRHLLPDLPFDQWRRIRGAQEIIVNFEPERALSTLPKLLADPADRERLGTFFRALLADERFTRAKPSSAQLAMLDTIGTSLGAKPGKLHAAEAKLRRGPAKRAAARKTAVRARARPA
jgi:hypothetical protein